MPADPAVLLRDRRACGRARGSSMPPRGRTGAHAAAGVAACTTVRPAAHIAARPAVRTTVQTTARPAALRTPRAGAPFMRPSRPAALHDPVRHLPPAGKARHAAA